MPLVVACHGADGGAQDAIDIVTGAVRAPSFQHFWRLSRWGPTWDLLLGGFGRRTALEYCLNRYSVIQLSVHLIGSVRLLRWRIIRPVHGLGEARFVRSGSGVLSGPDRTPAGTRQTTRVPFSWPNRSGSCGEQMQQGSSANCAVPAILRSSSSFTAARSAGLCQRAGSVVVADKSSIAKSSGTKARPATTRKKSQLLQRSERMRGPACRRNK